MSGQASALPLLQYAMTELFERRRGTTISAAAYREIGGVTGALVQTADNVYDGFDEAARAQVRDVFLRLVTLGDGGVDTRRRVLVSELTGVGADHVPDILEAFGRHRLLSFDRDPVTRGPTVEIAHEALLTEWRRLAEWIDRARADVEAQRSLAASGRNLARPRQGSGVPARRGTCGSLRRMDRAPAGPPDRPRGRLPRRQR